MSENVIEVNHLTFGYPQTKSPALQAIDFSVKKGEFFCIIGANGAGKSTLCNALVGLIPHYFLGDMQGSVCVDGRITANDTVAELSRDIGLVFQNPFNQLSYTASTVAEELAYGLGNHGVPRSEMMDRVLSVAQKMRIDELLDRDPLTLSGGQVQRVAFGSAYIQNPSILVLDECATQLDPIGSDEVFEIVKQLNAEGITIVMADGNMDRVAQYADRVMLMSEGKQIAIDRPEEVFAREDLESLGVSAPVYYQITQALANQGVLSATAITKAQTLNELRKVL